MQILDDLGAHVANRFVVRIHSFNRLVHTPPKVAEIDLLDLKQRELFRPNLKVQQKLLEALEFDPELVADQTLHRRTQALMEIWLVAIVLENHSQVFSLKLIEEI